MKIGTGTLLICIAICIILGLLVSPALAYLPGLADDNQTTGDISGITPSQIFSGDPTGQPTVIPTVDATSTLVSTESPTVLPTDTTDQTANSKSNIPITSSPDIGNTTPVQQIINTTSIDPGSIANETATNSSTPSQSGKADLSSITASNTSVSGLNQTADLAGNSSVYAVNITPDLSISLTSSSSPYSNLVDPPLNTSVSDIFYNNVTADWVINQSGEYYLDLNPSNNSGGRVQFNSASNTFSNFGSGFGILINSTNVILDGMGATFRWTWYHSIRNYRK